MKRKAWKSVASLCWLGSFCCFILMSKVRPTRTFVTDRNRSFRAAIVTLTRGEPTPLLNMLHSIEYFFPQAIHKYPVIIFYDTHGTEVRTSTLDYIKSCVNQTIDFINRRPTTMHYRSMGYRLMCQFWSHTVFHHPLIKNHYDYIMRLDDDSYLLESFEYDLFEYTHANNLDYIYRALAWDIPMSGPDSLLPQYLKTYHNNCKSHCFPFQSYDSIYNNFFIARVHFWHQSKIEQFLNSLLLNDSILIYSLGDGNIHAVILSLASDTNRSRRIEFAYAHNIHIYGKRNKNFDVQHNYHNWFQILMNNSQYACRQLVLIEPYSKTLKYVRF